MPWSNLRRIVAGIAMITGVFALVIVIEGAYRPLEAELLAQGDFAESAWAGPVEYLLPVATAIVALLLVGIGVWMIAGPVQETQVEVEQRRIR